MEELAPNPDGCSNFEPNQFKKEKCKHCGQLWSSHKGVISEELVQSYQQAKLRIAETKEKKEAEARAFAQAKKNAKKKANQAVEDDWLFDGSKDDTSKTTADEDSDDDLGFRMFSAAELASAAPTSSDPDSRQLKVVNLIDWGECDIPEEPDENVAISLKTEAAQCPAVSSCAQVSEPKAPVTASAFGSAEFETDYLTEIQHLRERLADAEEEKRIQVDIVRDEVRDQQHRIADLRQHTTDLEAKLREAQRRIDESEARQRLADAGKQKTHQEDIVRDDVREKEIKISELTQRTADLGAKLYEAQKRIEELEVRERLAKAEVDKKTEVDIVCHKVGAEQQQIADWTQQAADLEAQLREAHKRIKDLEARQNLAAAGEEQKTEVASLHHEVREKQTQIAELTRQTTDLDAQLGETQNRVKDLEQSLLSVKQDATRSHEHDCEVEHPCAVTLEAEAKVEVELPASVTSIEESQASHLALQAECWRVGARWVSLRKEKAAHAQAVRDIRIYAEQQLAWVLQRVSVNPQVDFEKISTAAGGY